MKKNIGIIILSIIIVFILCKIMAPTIVTERKINFKNHSAHPNLSRKIDREKSYTNKNNPKEEINYYEETEDENYNEYEPPRFHHKGDFEYQEERENTPIRFPKEQRYNENITRDISEISPEPDIIQIQKETAKTIKHHPKEPQGFAQYFRNCKPYKEQMDSEYMGINMHYEIEILGWINDKCTIKFTSKATGIGNSFGKEYGLDPSDANISTFAPNVKCEFSKAQLLYVGDSILQENERNNGAQNNMLKNPNQIEFPEFENMTMQDLKLLQVIFADKACKILNLEELKNILKTLTEF